jgi:hypothetical protein
MENFRLHIWIQRESYVRNTINLSWDKILLTSVIRRGQNGSIKAYLVPDDYDDDDRSFDCHIIIIIIKLPSLNSVNAWTSMRPLQ